MKTIDATKIRTKLSLPDGSAIVLLDRLAAPPSISDEEVERNVYRLSPNGIIQWQLDAGSVAYQRTPFTGIEFGDNGMLTAYRWDGTEYCVDLDTGTSIPQRLSK